MTNQIIHEEISMLFCSEKFYGGWVGGGGGGRGIFLCCFKNEEWVLVVVFPAFLIFPLARAFNKLNALAALAAPDQIGRMIIAQRQHGWLLLHPRDQRPPEGGKRGKGQGRQDSSYHENCPGGAGGV